MFYQLSFDFGWFLIVAGFIEIRCLRTKVEVLDVSVAVAVDANLIWVDPDLVTSTDDRYFFHAHAWITRPRYHIYGDFVHKVIFMDQVGVLYAFLCAVENEPETVYVDDCVLWFLLSYVRSSPISSF